jgi:hypothetical protein
MRITQVFLLIFYSKYFVQLIIGLLYNTIAKGIITRRISGGFLMSEHSDIYRLAVLFKFHNETHRNQVEWIEQVFRTLCAELPFV